MTKKIKFQSSFFSTASPLGGVGVEHKNLSEKKQYSFPPILTLVRLILFLKKINLKIAIEKFHGSLNGAKHNVNYKSHQKTLKNSYFGRFLLHYITSSNIYYTYACNNLSTYIHPCNKLLITQNSYTRKKNPLCEGWPWLVVAISDFCSEGLFFAKKREPG